MRSLFSVGGAFSNEAGCSFFLEREIRNVQVCNYVPVHVLFPKFWLEGQALGRSITGKLVTTKFWEEILWLDISEWTRKL